LPIAIADEGFVIECYRLVLGSYQMVLGAQWLEALGPILWDFIQCTLTRVKDSNLVLWTTINEAPLPPKLMTATGQLMTATKDDLGCTPKNCSNGLHIYCYNSSNEH
jgi:hypothetical protein